MNKVTINGPPTPIDRERRPIIKCGVFVMHRSEEVAQVDGNTYAKSQRGMNCIVIIHISYSIPMP